MSQDAGCPYERLYLDHHGWLLGWLGRKLGCPHDAADLSHDTFLRLLRGRDLPGLREPRAYLLVIANRLLINRHRRRKVEEEALRQVAVLLEREERRGPAETVVAQDLLAQVLLLLTEELPEKPRRAFLMARVDGKSYREIAARLDVSESSVKQYLAKVLAHCHARLYDSSSGEGGP
ncbi:MAG: sigma-70 family RNA polymerase sigma factor [Gammaproteobacteria bacterium]|nr:sigma-70 family RNA polymerase sigma factor [Gammaproteobacteria bacterium]